MNESRQGSLWSPMSGKKGEEIGIEQPRFLPMSREEAKILGIDRFDIILVSGDAYVDHPSFATALLGRVLWNAGFSVGVIAQPDWREDTAFLGLGAPRLFFSVSSGNVDSMVNHYTANLKRRSGDVYSPGGAIRRPDRATIVYTNRLHALFPGTPLIIGGIEASLRRFAHYDYWSDRVRQGILADAPADILVFGMGERQLIEIAGRLATGESIAKLTAISGTAYRENLGTWRSTSHPDQISLPSFTTVSTDKRAYAQAFAIHSGEQDPFRGRPVAQEHPKTVIIQNSPALPLSASELDSIHELPYTRRSHPSYREPVPALGPVEFSVVSHRGCFGGCAFCALSHHQGRIVQSRSEDSIVREVMRLTRMPGFRGIIHDIGGPTANMYGSSCARWEGSGTCSDKPCTTGCALLSLAHERQIHLLRRLRAIPGVKKIFIGSGIRYDLVLADPAPYLEEICRHHISGHLKVAPEHISPHVTDCMRKPAVGTFETFLVKFEELQKGKERREYLLPYFMSGHPGCSLNDMIDLACYIRDRHLYTEQVQDFTPTPMSLSTCMYYTGLDPFTLQPVHIPKKREKQIQRALLHFREPKNRALVREGLTRAGRGDLIGSGPGDLISGKSEDAARVGSKGKKNPTG